jgi:hypothetical protein
VDSVWEQEKLEARKMLAVGAARREAAVPHVRCTLCSATTNLSERWLLKRRKALLTNSHRDDFANDKQDVISLLFVNIFIVQFYNA